MNLSIFLFYIGVFQSFQPTYYSGFSAFFQLSKEEWNRPFERFHSSMSIKFPLKSDNDTAKEQNCKDEIKPSK